MEKLIDLLNKEMEEKEKAWPKLARFTSYDGINKVFNLNNGCSFCVEFVLSKRYRFIKRLIENDKIDTNKLEKIWYEETVYMYDWQYREIVEYSDYESLLILLSIQDKPIEFLISVLK